MENFNYADRDSEFAAEQVEHYEDWKSFGESNNEERVDEPQQVEE